MERVSFAFSMASSGALDCSGVWHVSCIAGASTRSGSELCARRAAPFLVLGAAVAPHSGRRLVFARDRGLEL